jgi:hypothetical protein
MARIRQRYPGIVRTGGADLRPIKRHAGSAAG